MIATTIDELEPIAPPAPVGEPPWPVALLFPRQGDWTETEFLALDTNRIIELSDGCLEVLPMPQSVHALITQLVCRLLENFVYSRKLGLVFQAPFPVRLWPEKIREPDLIFLRPGRLPDRESPAAGADLAIEVVSDGTENRKRDFITKRSEYAVAGIPEYWIVDPYRKRISVLTLQGKTYKNEREFTPGEIATSLVLPGFEVDVTSVFAVEELLPPEKKRPARSKSSKRKPKRNH